MTMLISAVGERTQAPGIGGATRPCVDVALLYMLIVAGPATAPIGNYLFAC